MSDQETNQEQPETTEQTPDNVRSTPAFQAVTRQLNEERKRISDMQSEISKFREAEEKRQLIEQEKAGEYDKVKESLQAKIEAQQSQLEQWQAKHETANIKADLKAALVAEGATNPKALEFICADYLSLEEKPDPAEWAKTVATSDDYGVFFAALASQATGSTVPTQSSVAGAPNRVDWSKVKEDLNDRSNPKASQKAARAIEAHMKQHGKMPW